MAEKLEDEQYVTRATQPTSERTNNLHSPGSGLDLIRQPLAKLAQRNGSMADCVFLLLVHLGKSLALAFEDGIPT